MASSKAPRHRISGCASPRKRAHGPHLIYSAGVGPVSETVPPSTPLWPATEIPSALPSGRQPLQTGGLKLPMPDDSQTRTSRRH